MSTVHSIFNNNMRKSMCMYVDMDKTCDGHIIIIIYTEVYVIARKTEGTTSFGSLHQEVCQSKEL